MFKKIILFIKKIRYFKDYRDRVNKIKNIKKDGRVEISGRFIYEPTVRCNLNCKMCYIPAEVKHSSHNELSLQQIKDLFSPMVDIMDAVNIIGGEPFCRKDILEIIKFFSDNKIEINSLATNATLINDNRLEELIKIDSLKLVAVSIDSADPNLHDSIRGVKGSFDRSVKAIKGLIDSEKEVHIVTVILKNNLSKLKEILDLGKELNVSKVIFEYERYYTVDEIEGTKRIFGLNSNELDVPASASADRGYKFSDLKKAVKEIRQYAKNKDMSIGFFPGYFLDKMKDCYNREIRKNNKVFCSAFFRPRIDQAGNLFFCYLIKKKIANLTQDKLTEIWNSDELRKFRMDLLNNNMSPICEGCFYLRIL